MKYPLKSYILAAKHPSSTATHNKYKPMLAGSTFGNAIGIRTLNPSSDVGSSGVLSSASIVLHVNPDEENPKRIIHYGGTAYEYESRIGRKIKSVIEKSLKFNDGNGASELTIQNGATYFPTNLSRGKIVDRIHSFQTSDGMDMVMTEKIGYQ